MGTSVTGYTRPSAAEKDHYKYANMLVSVVNYPQTTWPVAVSYSGAAANQKYLDQEFQSQIVCSGVPHLFTFGLGIQKTDQLDGELASFVTYGLFRLPCKTGDTPAAGAFLYWDDTNKYLTTTSGGNSKAAIAMTSYTEWGAGSATNPNLPPLVSGRSWGIVELRPML
jgi:predicted RecA/RadA family phage recombinase